MSRIYRMALIPKLFSHWWETLEHPHRLIDQHFGSHLNPEQFFNSAFLNRRYPIYSPFNYYRPWADLMRDDESGWSVVKNDKDKFHVTLDVQQFKPEEVNVKIVDNYIVIEGKHEDKQDEHGTVSRHFIRKYMIPEQCDPEKASSTISTDGVLTVTAPRKPESLEDKKERVLKVEITGKPSIEYEEKKKASSKQ